MSGEGAAEVLEVEDTLEDGLEEVTGLTQNRDRRSPKRASWARRRGAATRRRMEQPPGPRVGDGAGLERKLKWLTKKK